jgi:plastocyanin
MVMRTDPTAAAVVLLSCALVTAFVPDVQSAVGRKRRPAVEPAAVAVAGPASTTRGAGTGRLEGRVVLGPRLSSKRMRFSAYPDARLAEAARAPRGAAEPGGEFSNVVVFLEASPGLEGRGRQAGRPLEVRQEGQTFVPHVLPVLKGSIVSFPNTDPVFHNVFSLSRAASFDLGRYPRGEAKSVRFDTPGIVKVFCHIHSDMSAVIFVLDNPYFAVPDSRGAFRIDGIPPGEYRATGWHERAQPVSMTVRIDAGTATPAEFDIPLEEKVD